MTKRVKENASAHEAALKEIGYNLVIFKNSPDTSTEILLKLFYKYDLDKTMMERMLSLNRSCANAFIQEQIGDIIKKTKRRTLVKDARESIRMSQVPVSFLSISTDDLLVKVLPFLNSQEQVSLLLLNSDINLSIKRPVYGQLLKRRDLSFETRKTIYGLLVPKNLKGSFEPKRSISLKEENSSILELDMARTCSEDSETSEVDLNLIRWLNPFSGTLSNTMKARLGTFKV